MGDKLKLQGIWDLDKPLHLETWHFAVFVELDNNFPLFLLNEEQQQEEFISKSINLHTRMINDKIQHQFESDLLLQAERLLAQPKYNSPDSIIFSDSSTRSDTRIDSDSDFPKQFQFSCLVPPLPMEPKKKKNIPENIDILAYLVQSLFECFLKQQNGKCFWWFRNMKQISDKEQKQVVLNLQRLHSLVAEWQNRLSYKTNKSDALPNVLVIQMFLRDLYWENSLRKKGQESIKFLDALRDIKSAAKFILTRMSVWFSAECFFFEGCSHKKLIASPEVKGALANQATINRGLIVCDLLKEAFCEMLSLI